MGAWEARRGLLGTPQPVLACLVVFVCLLLTMPSSATKAPKGRSGVLASGALTRMVTGRDPPGAGEPGAGLVHSAGRGVCGVLGPFCTLGAADLGDRGISVPGFLSGGALRLRGGGRIRLRFKTGLPGTGKKSKAKGRAGRSASPGTRSGSPGARTASLTRSGSGAYHPAWHARGEAHFERERGHGGVSQREAARALFWSG